MTFRIKEFVFATKCGQLRLNIVHKLLPVSAPNWFCSDQRLQHSSLTKTQKLPSLWELSEGSQRKSKVKKNDVIAGEITFGISSTRIPCEKTKKQM